MTSPAATRGGYAPNDLLPAPLRILPRKTELETERSECSPEQPDPDTTATLSSTSDRGTSAPPSPSPLTRALSQRRPAAPKLGSLVSKFEILDAVNSTGACPPSPSKSFGKAKSNATPQTSGGLKPNPQSDQKTPSSVAFDTSTTTGNSSDVSPRHVRTPVSGESRKSMLPVSTRMKTNRPGDSGNAYPSDDIADDPATSREDQGRSWQKATLTTETPDNPPFDASSSTIRKSG
ncbi:hypothetical protein GGR56DRAFT_143096 [Xylariaceae sp. FL0804]|nr:hypothetical protein GGR56DRAFT_143096 [Xylariaceae sp. FL0804]